MRFLPPVLVVLALMACGQSGQPLTAPPPVAVVRPAVPAVTTTTVDTTTVDAEAVALWHATTLWNDTVVWNEAVAQNEREAAEAASRRATSEPYQRPTSYTGGGVWAALAECESGGDWGYNGSSGYDGGLQFAPSTWTAYKLSGYPAYAWQATPAQQIAVAERVLAAQGWGAWPACSRALGLR